MKKTLFATLTGNVLSLLGVILAVASAVLIVALSAIGAGHAAGSSFLAIVTYLVLPGTLVLGVLLIPFGLWLQHRRERRAAAGAAGPPPLPVLDLNSPATRARVATVGLIAFAAVVILAGAGYKGVEVLESVSFCSDACHTQMQPEAVAHDRSPHANVACVECHVGPGADWFVRSKINGLIEMVEVAFNTYPRPIPVPIHNLRPAREVCEQCHWPAKFEGDKLVVRTHYKDDETNSATKTVMMLHIGGQAGKSASGIHWHVGSGVAIRYLSDPTRETIYTVEMKSADGAVKTFKNSGVPPVDAQWRTMDCVDCHSRPAHGFRQPDTEIEAALEDGRIDTSLPFIRREGLRILKADYPSQEQARAGILREVQAFYTKQYPDVSSERASAVTQAGKALGDMWSWNVFPQMKVTWDTYPLHIGHQQSPGCLRCHDNKHVTATGEKIGKKCETCHNVVAEEEAAPEALKPFE